MSFTAEENHFFVEVLEKIEEIEQLFEDVGFDDLDHMYPENEENVSDSELTSVRMLSDFIMQSKELAQNLANE